nr:hypothetical protein [uncultured Bifidobacterium sp.]
MVSDDGYGRNDYIVTTRPVEPPRPRLPPCQRPAVNDRVLQCQ